MIVLASTRCCRMKASSSAESSISSRAVRGGHPTGPAPASAWWLLATHPRSLSTCALAESTSSLKSIAVRATLSIVASIVNHTATVSDRTLRRFTFVPLTFHCLFALAWFPLSGRPSTYGPHQHSQDSPTSQPYPF